MANMSQGRSAGYGRRLVAIGLMAALALPAVVWADSPVFAVFGQPAYTDPDGNVIDAGPGVPLTCANASKAAEQMNSGISPGMHAASVDSGNLTGSMPYNELQLRGPAARLVRDTITANWAPPPPGSSWATQMWPNDVSTTEYIAFPVAIYIPTAADAARMRVTMRYRAKDQLVAIYRNELNNGNTLAAPLTADTWSKGSAAGTLALDSGWRVGENVLTFVVRGKADDADGNMMTAFAAAFDAYCAPITPTAVPTSNEWGLLLLGLLAAGAGAVQLRRRR